MNKNIDYLLTRGPSMVIENIGKIQNKIAKVIDDTLNVDMSNLCSDSALTPAADFYEEDNVYHIDIDIPGVDAEEVELTCHANKLVVTGARKSTCDAEMPGSRDYITQEVSYGTFAREFEFPAEVNENKIKAIYANGILSIKVPRRESATKVKKIKIETVKETQ